MVDMLMDFAMEELQARLEPRGCCTDDWQWNERCFQFVVLYADGSMSDPYRFCCDMDEDYEENKLQFIDWLDWKGF